MIQNTDSQQKLSAFAKQVYSQLKKVPKGRVTTYAVLARSIGTKAYRAVGMVLSKNPYAPVVPCHRVVRSDGNIGGFMGHKNGKFVEKKMRMLKEEGIAFQGNKVKNFEKVLVKKIN